ncbi:MAG: hypothetical protein ACYDH9_16275 [Limisphaerales bacterium]
MILSADESGALTATINQQTRLSLQTLRDQGPKTIDGIQLSPGADASSVIIRGEQEEVVVEAGAFTGWAARVPQANQVTFRVDTPRTIIDLTAPAENTKPITLRFPDGGRAEIKAASTARFDLLKDGSYYFSGRGSVYAINNAGLSLNLSPNQPPMTGGPLVEKTAENGAVKPVRVTPVALVAVVSGELGGELSLVVETETVKLGTSEPKTVKLPNGSVIELKQNPFNRTLGWRVEKGCFRFQIEGMNCWHPIGLSGQAAAMQWNVSSKMADLSNLSTNQDVLVDLAIHYFADVGPKTIFQYTQFDDCRTFMVSATGGSVALFNVETGRAYPVDLNSFLVKAGVPEREDSEPDQKPANPRRTILLFGESGSQFQVQGSLGNAAIGPNSQKTLQGGDSGEVQMAYDGSGRLTVRAVSGDFLILMPTAGSFSVNLSQGDTISMSGVSPAGLSFQAASANLSSVSVTVARQTLSFGPSAEGTFKTGVGDIGPSVVNTSGNITRVSTPGNAPLNEAAGANPPGSTSPTAVPSTPGVLNPNQIDVSRIQQLPVSPFR